VRSSIWFASALVAVTITQSDELGQPLWQTGRRHKLVARRPAANVNGARTRTARTGGERHTEKKPAVAGGLEILSRW